MATPSMRFSSRVANFDRIYARTEGGRNRNRRAQKIPCRGAAGEDLIHPPRKGVGVSEVAAQP